jgi:predicted TIM-barrel fold metal-dependent hydrolase
MRRCGFPFYGRPELSTSAALAEAWRPWIETCIEVFGADRCLFESNFPVDKQSASYRVLWNAFKRLAGGASPAERAALLHDTATRFYRLTP